MLKANQIGQVIETFRVVEARGCFYLENLEKFAAALYSSLQGTKEMPAGFGHRYCSVKKGKWCIFGLGMRHFK